MIKQFKWMLAAILTLSGAMNAGAQPTDNGNNNYVVIEQLPDAGYFLPAPPDSSSAKFLDDIAQWQWGKTMASTERGARASRESLLDAYAIASVMAQVLQLDAIDDEQTPAIFRLVAKSFITGVSSTKGPKSKYMRKRPFAQMNETAWGEYDDTETMLGDGSYPSGHTASAWATALALAEMWPALQDTILCRGFEYGENRIIVNAHWQSDVTAGYLCGAAAIARAHCEPEFEQDIRAARAEYARLKGLPEDYDPAAEADVPHGERFLNNPVDTASARYQADLMLYWSNKPIRSTERGDTAAVEAEYSVAMMQKVMSEAIGITISDLQTPAITRLLSHVLDKASETADRLKPIRFRKRPFVQLGEPSAVAGDEEKERGKSSFPSGHTNLGWTEALVMTEVAPEHQNEILRRGYEYGHNRLIVGYHWYTDIEATRQLASALVARLHADPAFLDMIAAARAEYEGITTGIVPVSRVIRPSSSQAYRLDGTLTTDYTHGIVIENQHKIVRRYNK
ncbi:MAG: phosphatase PAP2 family protein [Prevotella sp.]|nr:phosphatase PAP2 family protein [Prevotella sp.]